MWTNPQVLEHLDIRGVDRIEEAKLEIGLGHVPFRADPFREPPGDRATPAADLQTVDGSTDREPLIALDRQRVETRLDSEEARLVIGADLCPAPGETSDGGAATLSPTFQPSGHLWNAASR
jgi:hypothetical protein